MPVDVHIYDGRSLVGQGKYDPQTGRLSDVNQRGISLAGHTVSLVSIARPSVSFIGNLEQTEGGFRLKVNPQT